MKIGDTDRLYNFDRSWEIGIVVFTNLHDASLFFCPWFLVLIELFMC